MNKAHGRDALVIPISWSAHSEQEVLLTHYWRTFSIRISVSNLDFSNHKQLSMTRLRLYLCYLNLNNKNVRIKTYFSFKFCDLFTQNAFPLHFSGRRPVVQSQRSSTRPPVPEALLNFVIEPPPITAFFSDLHQRQRSGLHNSTSLVFFVWNPSLHNPAGFYRGAQIRLE